MGTFIGLLGSTIVNESSILHRLTVELGLKTVLKPETRDARKKIAG